MRISVRRLLGLTAAVALAAGMTACSSDSATPAPTETGKYAKDANTIVFGAVPDQAAAQNLNQPLADYIGKITGKTVEYYKATDYAALIEATIAGHVDVAYLSGFTYYVAASQGANITPFAAAVTKEGAKPGYYSVAIANPKSTVTDLKGYAGKKVCFVSETSTSGRLFPLSLLQGAGVAKESYTTVLAGSHDASAQKVAQGTECDAGFAEDVVAEPLIASGKVKEIQRVLVPGAPIVVQNALPAALKNTIIEKTKSASWKDMQTAGVADAGTDWFKKWIFKFEPVDDAYYNTIRDLCTRIQAPACKA